jgi:hypothetical protein
VTFLHGARLRALFVIALTHGDMVNLGAVWEQFRAEFSDDLPPRLRQLQLQPVPELEFPEQDYALYPGLAKIPDKRYRFLSIPESQGIDSYRYQNRF